MNEIDCVLNKTKEELATIALDRFIEDLRLKLIYKESGVHIPTVYEMILFAENVNKLALRKLQILKEKTSEREIEVKSENS